MAARKKRNYISLSVHCVQFCMQKNALFQRISAVVLIFSDEKWEKRVGNTQKRRIVPEYVLLEIRDNFVLLVLF